MGGKEIKTSNPFFLFEKKNHKTTKQNLNAPKEDQSKNPHRPHPLTLIDLNFYVPPQPETE